MKEAGGRNIKIVLFFTLFVKEVRVYFLYTEIRNYLDLSADAGMDELEWISM